MGAHQLAGDGQAEAGPARVRRAGKRLEQVCARARRESGAVVGHVDDEAVVVAARGDLDLGGAGLDGVLAQVAEHPVQLLAVGGNLEVFLDQAMPPRLAVELLRQGGADLPHQFAQVEAAEIDRRGALAGEVQRLGAEVDRAVDGAEQGRRGPAHLRVLALDQAVRHQARGGQDVAQVVADLGDAGAERGQAGALPQGAAQALLHLGQLALGDADLVAARRGLDDARGVLGIVAEPGHGLGDAAHGPDHEQVQAQIDEGRGEERNDQRQRQDALRIAEHLAPQRRLLQDHLDQGLAILGRYADDPQDAAAVVHERHEGIADQAEEAGLAQVIAGVDRARGGHHQHQLAGARPGQADRIGAHVVEQLALQVLADHLVRRRLQRQDRQVRGGQAFLEIDQPETADRRRVDQHLGQHHEGDGQQQEPRRQALGQRRQAELLAGHGRILARLRRKCRNPRSG